MLHISKLKVNYGSTNILDAIDLSFEKGVMVALLGPNGTGKSTLLKAIAGLIPAQGQITVRGASAKSSDAAIAYMPQDTSASSSLTVLEVILLGRIKSLGLRIADNLVDEASACLRHFGIENLSTKRLDTISGGQRQMVYLAQSLFCDPYILLLDEPTAALDLRHQLMVLDHVVAHCHAKQTIAIAAMHDLSLAAKCADRVICLCDGEIVADGTPEKVLTKPLIRDIYGVDADVVYGTNGTMHITPLRAINSLDALITAEGGAITDPQGIAV